MIYAIIALLIIVGILGYKLSQKQKIDRTELNNFNTELKEIKREIACADNILKEQGKQVDDLILQVKEKRQEYEYEQYKLDECKKDLQIVLETYSDITENKLKQLDASMEEQRKKRQADLDKQFEESKQALDLKVERYKNDCEKLISQITDMTERSKEENLTMVQQYHDEIETEKQRYESLLGPIKLYEKERQEKLFYTIQLPEEYYEDIEFLLTTVSAKVQHPDIISKLVWAEYVKPNLDDTFKRIEIKGEPGIYKLTSLQNGKCYIGKSTNVKNRIADHFKSVVGIKSIADQAVHHAILKEGFWNWQIEVVTYCNKDELSELEKYYIDFFKSQEFGYNKNAGG